MMNASAVVHVKENVLFLQLLQVTANMLSMLMNALVAVLVQVFVL